MANFDLYVPTLFAIEGKLGKTTNNKNDKGGWTNAGVTLDTFREFFGADKTVNDLRLMTAEQWRRIMKTYWDECKADKIKNQSIAELVVDWNINSGISGRKATQKVLGTTVDGIFGPKTLALLNAEPQECIFYKILSARISFFCNIVDRTPGQIANLNGWINHRLGKFKYEK